MAVARHRHSHRLIVTEAVGSRAQSYFDSGAALEVRIEAADKAGTVELTIEDNAATAAAGREAPSSAAASA